MKAPKDEDEGSEATNKIRNIIQKEFLTFLGEKEKEIEEIDATLLKVQKSLHILRYCSVLGYYGNTVNTVNASNGEVPSHPSIQQVWKEQQGVREQIKANETKKDSSESNISFPGSLKIPSLTFSKDESSSISSTYRNASHRYQRRLVIGNVSKFIQCDQRDDLSTHKWMIYVRGDKNEPDVSDIIAKVRFLIHPSYHPHDSIEVTDSPFNLTRRGWGEFPARVKVFFKDPRDKPIDVIHHLKLDRTYTGLQTHGSETVVDVWLHHQKRSLQDNSSANTEKTEHQLFENTSEEGYVIKHDDFNMNDILFNNTTSRKEENNTFSSILKPSQSFKRELEVSQHGPKDGAKNADGSKRLKLNSGVSLLKKKPSQSSSMLYPATELEKRIPQIPMSTWTSILGRNPMDSQKDLEQNLLRHGSSVLEKFLTYCSMIRSRLNVFKKHDAFNLETKILYFAKCFPLIGTEAKNKAYKCLIPYSYETSDEFFSQSLIKQFSAEWNYALSIGRLLKQVNGSRGQVAEISTKNILQTLREHGYLPRGSKQHSKKHQKPVEIQEVPELSPLSHSLSTEGFQLLHATKVKRFESLATFAKVQHPKLEKYECLPPSPGEINMLEFITVLVKSVGNSLEEGQVIDGTHYPFTQKMLLQAMRCFCELLLRKSFRTAYRRTFQDKNISPEISISDVAETIRSDSRLNWLTKQGLAKEPK